MALPAVFTGVTATTLANVYFDGKVISHSLTLADGSRKTLGLIFPGTFKFNTAAAERMEITAGTCRVRLAGATDWTTYPEGSTFEVAGNSHFEIAVDDGIAQYICSFL